MKLLFAGAVALAVLTVSCTTLMPVAQSRLAEGQGLPLQDAVAAAFSEPTLDPQVQADILELQATALLDCIAADTAGVSRGDQPTLDPINASSYGALYEKLHAQPDIQRALALMQAAQRACGGGSPRRVAQLQRAAFALDRQVDAARGGATSPTDGHGLAGH